VTEARQQDRKRLVRIGYDASSTVGQRTGIGICAAHLLSALADELPENWQIHALVNSAKHPLPSNDPWVGSPRIKIRHTKLPGRLLLRSWQYLHAPPIETFLGSLDLYHSPASYVTPSISARQVITVHDLFFLRQRDPVDLFGGQYFEKTFPKGLPKARAIITVSEYTRSEVLLAYDVEPDRVFAVPNGYEEKYFNMNRQPDEEAIIQKWSRGALYLLCVASSGPSPRKNMEGLLEAYAKARAMNQEIPQLIIAGHSGSQDEQQRFKTQLERLHLEPYAHRTGYLRPEELACLYRNATAMIMPSLCEGFGLPVVEAMACGCPVIAANAGSLPEIAGDAAILMDIESTEQMARTLLQVYSDTLLQGKLTSLGATRAKQFSWKSSAKKTLEIYAEALRAN